MANIEIQIQEHRDMEIDIQKLVQIETQDRAWRTQEIEIQSQEHDKPLAAHSTQHGLQVQLEAEGLEKVLRGGQGSSSSRHYQSSVSSQPTYSDTFNFTFKVFCSTP